MKKSEGVRVEVQKTPTWGSGDTPAAVPGTEAPSP
jgi:hypothetical protein